MRTINNAGQELGVVQLESVAPLKGSTNSPCFKLMGMSTDIPLIDGVEWVWTIALLPIAK